MRRKIAIIAAILIVAGIAVAFVCLIPRQPRAGPWRLADGSELSLAGVTYGRRHAMRYGNRLVDYLYPVLPDSLRKKFGCKVATMSTQSSNAIVLWFWDKDVAWMRMSNAAPSAYYLAAIDDSGMEEDASFHPDLSVLWHQTNVLQGVELFDFPRRSAEFGVRIYNPSQPEHAVAEFKVQNRTKRKYPAWHASPFPATAKTNGLEVTLTAFETRMRNYAVEHSGLGMETDYKTRMGFVLSEDGKRAEENWQVESVTVTAATGETRELYPWRPDNITEPAEEGLFFEGNLWAEEPAWKLTVKVTRIANFPANELWMVKGIPKDQHRNLGITTNIYGSEIEVAGLGGRLLILRSPLPEPDTRLKLLKVTDDQGRKVEFVKKAETPSTGGRGATLRELDQFFFVNMADDARTLDLTLAYTRSVFVEFTARPTVVK